MLCNWTSKNFIRSQPLKLIILEPGYKGFVTCALFKFKTLPKGMPIKMTQCTARWKSKSKKCFLQEKQSVDNYFDISVRFHPPR